MYDFEKYLSHNIYAFGELKELYYQYDKGKKVDTFLIECFIKSLDEKLKELEQYKNEYMIMFINSKQYSLFNKFLLDFYESIERLEEGIDNEEDQEPKKLIEAVDNIINAFTMLLSVAILSKRINDSIL